MTRALAHSLALFCLLARAGIRVISLSFLPASSLACSLVRSLLLSLSRGHTRGSFPTLLFFFLPGSPHFSSLPPSNTVPKLIVLCFVCHGVCVCVGYASSMRKTLSTGIKSPRQVHPHANAARRQIRTDPCIDSS